MFFNFIDEVTWGLLEWRRKTRERAKEHPVLSESNKS